MADGPENEAELKRRANYLNVDQQFILNHACRILWEAGLSCYQVGSSITRANYRDVDIRAILYGMDDEEEVAWEAIIKDKKVKQLVELSISCLLQRMTNLPVDFQIQTMTEANDDPKNKGQRNAMGIHVDQESAEYAAMKEQAKGWNQIMSALNLDPENFDTEDALNRITGMLEVEERR